MTDQQRRRQNAASDNHNNGGQPLRKPITQTVMRAYRQFFYHNHMPKVIVIKMLAPKAIAADRRAIGKLVPI